MDSATVGLSDTDGMVSKIGFFHLGQSHCDPVEALKGKLQDTAVSNALIVLPEAFNLGRSYRDGGIPAFRRGTTSDALCSIASDRQLTLVVGLVDDMEDGGDGTLPYSSAYVIADGRSKPICHKAKSDANEGTLYRCCTKGCDVENPTMASGDRMAIICRDIEDSARCAGITRLIEE